MSSAGIGLTTQQCHQRPDSAVILSRSGMFFHLGHTIDFSWQCPKHEGRGCGSKVFIPSSSFLGRPPLYFSVCLIGHRSNLREHDYKEKKRLGRYPSWVNPHDLADPTDQTKWGSVGKKKEERLPGRLPTAPVIVPSALSCSWWVNQASWAQQRSCLLCLYCSLSQSTRAVYPREIK